MQPLVLYHARDMSANRELEHRDFFGDDVEGDHFVVLGKEDGVGEADVAGSGDGYLYRGKVQGARGKVH